VLLIAIPVTADPDACGAKPGHARGIRQAQSRRGRRHSDTAAKHSSLLSFSAASMPENLVKWGQQQPHVTLAVGTAIAVVSGITSVSGVDLDAFSKMSGGSASLKAARSKGRTIF